VRFFDWAGALSFFLCKSGCFLPVVLGVFTCQKVARTRKNDTDCDNMVLNYAKSVHFEDNNCS
jgi:hypothetical protein